MSNKRLHPDDRKDQILTAALKVAGRPGGWAKLTRDAVAKEASCAEGLPSKYFGTMPNFRRAVMRAAIRAEALQVIAQGLAAGDRIAQRQTTPELRARALQVLAR